MTYHYLALEEEMEKDLEEIKKIEEIVRWLELEVFVLIGLLVGFIGVLVYLGLQGIL
jgi:type II secretory pathway component PulF